MDRRAWKEAAREDVALAKDNSVLVTQVYLILTLSLTALNLCVALLLRQFGPSGGYLSDSISAGGRNYLIQWLFNLLRGFGQILLTAGYTAFILRLIRREAPGLDALWAGLRRPGRVIWLSILEGIFVALWMLLFVLVVGLVLSTVLYFTVDFTDLSAEAAQPSSSLLLLAAMSVVCTILLLALIFSLVYRYYAAYFLLMEYPQLTARQALKLSVTITKGHKWKLFVLDLSFLPWILLSYLTLDILLIWKLPYFQATRARAYRAMMDDYGQRRNDLRAYWDSMWVKEPAQGPGQDTE